MLFIHNIFSFNDIKRMDHRAGILVRQGLSACRTLSLVLGILFNIVTLRIPPRASSSLAKGRYHATSSTTPPASLTFRSASLLTYRALMTIGTSGKRPLPRSLAYPKERRSITGAWSDCDLALRYLACTSSGTRDQSYLAVLAMQVL